MYLFIFIFIYLHVAKNNKLPTFENTLRDSYNILRNVKYKKDWSRRYLIALNCIYRPVGTFDAVRRMVLIEDTIG